MLSPFSLSSFDLFVSSGWWKVAVGCSGLAEGDVSEPFCGDTSLGRMTLPRTFTAVNLRLSAVRRRACWCVCVLQELPSDPRRPLTVELFLDGLSLSRILCHHDHATMDQPVSGQKVGLCFCHWSLLVSFFPQKKQEVCHYSGSLCSSAGTLSHVSCLPGCLGYRH